MPEVKVYRLFQLCESISKVLNAATGGKRFWVSCEIVRISERRGHRYIELVDMEQEQEIARISAVMWSSAYKILFDKYGPDLASILEGGKKVLLECSIDFHEIFGLKLQIHNVDPLYTIGDLESKKRATLDRLIKEGLKDRNAQLHMPPVLKKILVVSSGKAAGLEDFENHLRLNSYNYGFSTLLLEAAVQGVAAEQEICSAIGRAQAYDADLIVIIRGGGSRLDLEVFNTYSVAHAIAQSRLPVITGIGHESDETVVDLVAHTRQKTPTAVAHFIIQHNVNYESKIQWAFERIRKEAKVLLQQHHEELTISGEKFQRMVQSRLIRESGKIERLRDRLSNSTQRFMTIRYRQQEQWSNQIERLAQRSLAVERGLIGILLEKLRSGAGRSIRAKAKELEGNQQVFPALLNRQMQKEREKMERAASFIKLVHPNTILKRGFVLVRSGDKILTKQEELEAGQEINLSFYTFEAEARVERVKAKKNGKKNG